MLKRIFNVIYDNRDRHRVSIKLLRGISGMSSRVIDLTKPFSWEFSGFSQNGEDGIIDVLLSKILISNRYFVEIGSADGIDNNSAWLLFSKGYNGIMIDGNKKLVNRAQRIVSSYSIGLQIMNLFVTKESVPSILKQFKTPTPDVFSLDIDGNDYFILEEFFKLGFRPKIVVVEYNSSFGPSNSITIKYDYNFNYLSKHSSGLYYGVSISAWKKFFSSVGYKFITVDSKGVNAFFVNPEYFENKFINGVDSKGFQENELQRLKFNCCNEKQFSLIKDMPFTEI
jgi:hypothetical protein